MQHFWQLQIFNAFSTQFQILNYIFLTLIFRFFTTYLTYFLRFSLNNFCGCLTYFQCFLYTFLALILHIFNAFCTQLQHLPYMFSTLSLNDFILHICNAFLRQSLISAFILLIVSHFLTHFQHKLNQF